MHPSFWYVVLLALPMHVLGDCDAQDGTSCATCVFQGTTTRRTSSWRSCDCSWSPSDNNCRADCGDTDTDDGYTHVCCGAGQQLVTRHLTSDQRDAGSGRTGTTPACVECVAGRPPFVAAGFTVIRIPDTEQRCPDECDCDQHLGGSSAVESVFRCHVEIDKFGQKRCPADAAINQCAPGYDGRFCSSCTGWRRRRLL